MPRMESRGSSLSLEGSWLMFWEASCRGEEAGSGRSLANALAVHGTEAASTKVKLKKRERM